MIEQVAAILMTAITSVLAGPPAVTSPPPPFESPSQDFRVSFPTMPLMTGHAPADDDDSGSWIYAVRLNGRSFMVRIDQYPNHIRVPAPNQRTYELLLRAHAEESSSRLVLVKPVEVAGLAGLQGDFVDARGADELVRVLMVGRRIYQLSYTLPPGGDGGEQGDGFLTSFQITAR